MFLKWGSQPWMIWRSHWQSRQTLGGRRVTFAILTAMGLFAAIPYTLINRFASVRDWAAFDPTLQLDIDIPFLAWMILPYMTLYLYYPVAAWLGSKNEVMWRQNVVFHQMMLLTCWGVNQYSYSYQSKLTCDISFMALKVPCGNRSMHPCMRSIPLGILGHPSILFKACRWCSSSDIGILQRLHGYE